MFFSDIRADYINNIMRNNADFINFNLEFFIIFLITKCWRETLDFLCKASSKRKTCFICNVCLLGTLYTFLFAISVYKVTL